ncbi:uncharacterized protein LOC108228108 [Daucus carota subsp. sativus]|uniref:uncharacterized protein LOC108228108 n=1 Tax=Daucus carota subsp. sativus TaxID=79200 RepID=UPI0007EF04DC|nr:PREDICTED: uncharacterized protein LOC108228108 [Daucus carota subsp. sativus]
MTSSSSSSMVSSTSSSRSWLGFPLLDVFNIVYLGLDEIKPEKQLGLIKLISSEGFQYLYRLEDVDRHRPCIRYGDLIPITVRGPSFPFFDHVFIEFDLFCGAYKGKKQLHWEPLPHEVSVKSVFITSNDGTGQILIHMGGYANATVADLELRLLDNSAPRNVRGVVSASNSDLELDHCVNMLFMKESDNGVVGHDGLISLSRSLIGVPLHSELNVEISLTVDGHNHTRIISFDPVKEGVCEKFISNYHEKVVLVKITWIDISEYDSHKDLIHRMYDQDSPSQRCVTPLSVAKGLFEVEEEVAHEFALLKDQIKDTLAENPTSHLSPVTVNIWSKIIYYCKIHVDPSTAEISFDPQFVRQLDLVGLFNLSQAANHLQIKSLMNLTCRTLVNKVKTKITEDIMKEFNVDDANIWSAKRLKRSFPSEDISHSEEDIPHIDSILRQRGKETFINKPLLVDVPISPVANARLDRWNPYFERCFSIFMDSANSVPSDPAQFEEATEWLNDLVNTDSGLACCLSSNDVDRLLMILAEIDDRKDLDVTIQSLAVRILSRALTHRTFHEYSTGAVPALVKLMSNPLTDLNIAGLMALTRLAYACPMCTQCILENGALEQAQEIANKIRYLPLPELRQWVAKFFAGICYRDLPDDKVKVALIISEDLFTKDSISHRHIVSTCYALQYLTYKRTVAIQGKAWDKLIRRLIGFIANCFRIDATAVACSPPVLFGSTVIGSSALGVVGNIARWGHFNQIQTLANDSLLLQCLRMMLCFKFKKFSKEACQIISNIAARSQPWIQDMLKANLIEPLYDLLENDVYESDVKMEAAWAIFNGICGNDYGQIDHYYGDSLPC